MAEQNTITTVFRADISQFSASAQQLNQYVRNVNSQFEAATAGMGKWSDNTDGLQAKIKQLNGVLEAEKKKLSLMVDRYNEMEKAGKGNTKEAENLKIAINKQVAVIKKTEKQTDDYTASLKELQDAGVKTKKELQDLTDAQDKQGKSAESNAGKLAKGLGAGIAAVGAGAVAAVGGFLSLAESTREYRTGLNQLETAFGRVGFTAEETYEAFNYFGSVLGDTRKAQETMLVLGQLVKSEQELEQWTDTLTGVFATYGEAIPLESMSEAVVLASKQAVAEGGLADALEWGGINLEQFNSELESLNSEEERAAHIQNTLNGLYGEAAENYKELNKDVLEASTAQTNLEHSMAKLGAVAEPIMTMLKNATAEFLGALEPAVQLMGEGLKGAFEGSADGAKKFADGLTGIVNTVLQKATELLPRLVDIVLQLIPSLTSALLGALPNLVTTLSQIVAQIVTALGALLPQIVQSIIDAIPQVVQALLNAVPQLLNAIVQFGTTIIQALPSIIDNLLSILPELITSIINALISFYPQIVQAAITLFMALVDALPSIIDSLIVALPSIVNATIDGLLALMPQLLKASITLFMAIVNALPSIIKSLVKELPKVVTTTVQTLTSRLPELINGAVQLFMGIVKAIPQIQSELLKQLPTIIKTIVSGLIQGIPDLVKAGGDLLAGLFKGLLNPTVIWNNIKSLGKSILNGVKSFFGIKSPSKVFEDQIGANLALGIGKGFDDEMDAVERSMQKTLSGLPSMETPNFAPVGGSNWVQDLADIVANKTAGEVVNNYNFDYKFERVQTSRLALHQAELATRRIVGGTV